MIEISNINIRVGNGNTIFCNEIACFSQRVGKNRIKPCLLFWWVWGNRYSLSTKKEEEVWLRKKSGQIQKLVSLLLNSSLPSLQLYAVKEDIYSLFPPVTLICKEVLAVKLGRHPPNLANMGLWSVRTIVNTDWVLTQYLYVLMRFPVKSQWFLWLSELDRWDNWGPEELNPNIQEAAELDFETEKFPEAVLLTNRIHCLSCQWMAGQASCTQKLFQNYCFSIMGNVLCPPPKIYTSNRMQLKASSFSELSQITSSTQPSFPLTPLRY